MLWCFLLKGSGPIFQSGSVLAGIENNLLEMY